MRFVGNLWFQCYIIVTSEVGKWLSGFDLGLYESYLLANGFDDLEFLVSFSPWVVLQLHEAQK